MKTILVPLDFSEGSQRIVDRAVEFAQLAKASMILLHVEQPDPEFVGYGVGPTTVRTHVAEDVTTDRALLNEMKSKVQLEGVDATALQVQGVAADCIVEQAEKSGAGLIIMGSHGHSAFYHMLMGSVTEGVLRKSQVPVMVVPLAED